MPLEPQRNSGINREKHPHFYPRTRSDVQNQQAVVHEINYQKPFEEVADTSQLMTEEVHSDIKSESNRMVLYSVVILVISVVIFAGVGYGVFVGLNKESTTSKEQNGSVNTSQNSSNPTNSSSSTASQTDVSTSSSSSNTQFESIKAKEDLPAVAADFVTDQAYNNAYLPDTTVTYSASWGYTNTTEASQYSNLIKRTITLTKGESVLIVAFAPKIIADCNKEKTELTKIRDITGSNLSRYQLDASDTYYYLPSSSADKFSLDCTRIAAKINSDVDAAISPEYAAAFPGENKVVTLVVVTLKTADKQNLVQADTMVGQSKFSLIK